VRILKQHVAQCFYLLTDVAESFGLSYWPYSGSSHFFSTCIAHASRLVTEILHIIYVQKDGIKYFIYNTIARKLLSIKYWCIFSFVTLPFSVFTSK